MSKRDIMSIGFVIIAIASIGVFIMGLSIDFGRDRTYQDTLITEDIDEARVFMRECVERRGALFHLVDLNVGAWKVSCTWKMSQEERL